MLHEQSREAYQFLFRYYSNIEPNKKQAFHWLKKMSYYGIPPAPYQTSYSKYELAEE